LHPPATAAASDDPAAAATEAPLEGGAVYVHCAMGKSRSVTAVAAYLLWKHPDRFGRSAAHAAGFGTAKNAAAPEGRDGDDDGASLEPKTPAPASSSKTPIPPARRAARAAVAWIKRSREIAEPNRGFMRQLEMWWDMGCPIDVEDHPVYQRWLYQREVRTSAAVGRAPDRLRFEDEEARKAAGRRDLASATASLAIGGGSAEPSKNRELRCKKCRRVLATGEFVLDHRPLGGGSAKARKQSSQRSQPLRQPPHQQQKQQQDSGQQSQQAENGCPHFFIEPLSWMRPTLQEGALDGRIACPGSRCGATVGRYSWKGFQCSCGGWVTPAFSLQKSKVDDVVVGGRSSDAAEAGTAGGQPAFGIRLPPGGAPPLLRRENL